MGREPGEPADTRAPTSASGIRNVLVMTSVRQGELVLRVDHHLVTPEAGATIVVDITELDGSGHDLPSGRFPLVDSSAGTWRQEVVLPWPAPTLWDVGAAHLYRAHLRIERSAGAPPIGTRPSGSASVRCGATAST